MQGNFGINLDTKQDALERIVDLSINETKHCNDTIPVTFAPRVWTTKWELQM